MRIGITTLGPSMDDQISAAFERGAYLLIVDTDTMQVEPEPYPGTNNSFGPKPHSPQHMGDLVVEMLVTGKIDPSISRLYASEGISFVAGMSGTARNFLDKYKNGEITPTSMPAAPPIVSGGGPDALSGQMAAMAGAARGAMGGMPGGMGAMGGGMGGPFGGGSLSGGAGMGGPFGGGAFGSGAMSGNGTMSGGFNPFDHAAAMAGPMPRGQFGPGPLSGLIGGQNQDGSNAAKQFERPVGGMNPSGMNMPPDGGAAFFEMQERVRQLEAMVFNLSKRLEALEKN